MTGDRYRNLRSKAIVFSSWEPIAATVRSGKRKPVEGSKGIVTISFRRNPGKYTYRLTRPFTMKEWLAWMSANSVGRWWNFKYLGRV